MAVKATTNKNSSSSENILGIMNHRSVREAHQNTNLTPRQAHVKFSCIWFKISFPHEDELPCYTEYRTNRSHTKSLPLSPHSAPFNIFTSTSTSPHRKFRSASRPKNRKPRTSNLQVTAPTGGSRTGHGVKGRTLRRGQHAKRSPPSSRLVSIRECE